MKENEKLICRSCCESCGKVPNQDTLLNFRWYPGMIPDTGDTFLCDECTEKLWSSSERAKMVPRLVVNDRTNSEKGWIRKLISKMNISSDSAAALDHYTTEIYNKLEEKGTMRGSDIRRKVAVATYLACDNKACVAVPKLRAATQSLHMREIGNVRKALKIQRGTAHQKLDSLCHVCHISDKSVISRAHDYVSLLGGSCSPPTSIAAAALSATDNKTLALWHSPLQEIITRATGVSAQTIYKTKNDIMEQKRKREDDKKNKNTL